MKINNLTGAPAFGAMFGPASGATLTLNSPLILASDPVDPLQAATKRYVTNSVTVVPAEKLISGTLGGAYIPSFGGDITKADGSLNISLVNRDRLYTPGQSVAGTYTRYDITAKGLVADGTSLLATDIPNLSWNKITTGKPTTTTGYGITDALAKTGGTLTNFLSLTNDPTANLHAASKAYADNRVASAPKYATGDIMIRPTTTTPSGFLRCNGAELNKTTYSALYAIVGDANNINAQPGGGRPWQNQYEINNALSSTLTWAAHSTFQYYPGRRSGVVLKNRVYLMNVNNTAGMAYSNTIDAAGSISTTWSSAGISMPAGTRLNCAPLVLKNRLYLIGGYDNNGTYLADVYSAPIDVNGNVGAWTQHSSMPSALQHAQAVYTKDRIYVFGGYNSSGNQAVVYTTTVDSNGLPGTWTTATSMPSAMQLHSSAVIKNRLYVFAGYNAGNLSTIYYAPINPDGTLGAWTSGGSLPVGSQSSEVFVVRNRVYYFVGNAGSGAVNTVYSAPINGDGSIGTWVADGTLNVAQQGFFVFATSSKLYLVGGDNGYTCSVATISGSPNDYSSYYNGSILPTGSANFKLPDYSVNEKRGMNYFVKT